MNQPIIIGISGASGTILGIRLLEIIKTYTQIPILTIISKAAIRTLHYETTYQLDDIKKLSDHFYPIKDIGANIASGSFTTRGMIIAPSSIKTMSQIAQGITGNLITRAADVCLKEKRPLIIGVREMPLHLGHLRNMIQLSEIGAIIAPPVPAFYHSNITLEKIIDQICIRWLSLCNIHIPTKEVWSP